MSSDVERIKQAVDITDVVGRYVELKKAGINYQARCPFHNEKTPSFYVSPERGTYKCFGCGEGGDVYSFLEKIEGLSFRESLEKLSTETGIQLENKSGGQTSRSREEKNKEVELLRQATLFWQKNLASNPSAIEYLKRRGFTKQQVIDYQIGYASDGWTNLRDYFLSLGVTEDAMETVGLIKKGDKGSYYDRFRERIIFPLRNVTGDVVAFSGRYTGTEDVGAKYLNSPDTMLFDKSKELYGLDTAKHAIRKNNFVVVVEGQVDLVMGQSVFPNTVATSGTSLTVKHLTSIRRFCDRIVFAFDSDNAGVNAAHKAANLALSLDYEVKIAQMKEGNDPADIILQDGDQYKEIVRNAQDIFDFWIDRIQQGDYTPREKTQLVDEKIVTLVAAHTNPLEQDRYIKHIGSRLDISPEALHARIAEVMVKTQTKQEVSFQQKDHQENAVTHNGHKKLQTRLAQIILWQDSLSKEKRWIERKTVLQELEKETKTQIEQEVLRLQNSPKLDEILFAIEKIYENDMILTNEILEITHNLRTSKNQKVQKELLNKHKQLLSEGKVQEAKTILRDLHNILTTHGGKKDNGKDSKKSDQKGNKDHKEEGEKGDKN